MNSKLFPPGATKRKLFVYCAISLATLFGLSPAMAQPDYPSKPIKLVVPFAAGGAADAMARALGQKLQETMGAQVVVENKIGAGGTIGTAYVAKAPADGYTLLLGNVSTLAIAPTTYPALSYDPTKDFKAVSLVGKSPMVFVAGPKLAARNVPELIALAKREPGRISFGSSGVGSVTHLTGELLNIATNSNMVHVPYKGSPSILVAVASGELELGVTQVVEMLPQYKAGRVKALAISGTEKSPPLPSVETAAASGVKNLEATTWYGVVAPAGVPDEVIAKLNMAVNAALNDAALVKRYADDGVILRGSDSVSFTKFIKDEVDVWAKVVKTAGVKLE